jgi:hypothetical protein
MMVTSGPLRLEKYHDHLLKAEKKNDVQALLASAAALSLWFLLRWLKKIVDILALILHRSAWSIVRFLSIRSRF